MCLFWQRGGRADWQGACSQTQTGRCPRRHARMQSINVKMSNFTYITKDQPSNNLREGQRCHLGKFTLTFYYNLLLFYMPANAYAGVWKLIKALMKYAKAADWAWILEGEIFSVYICCVLMNSEFQPSVLANTWCSWTAKWFQTLWTLERSNVNV